MRRGRRGAHAANGPLIRERAVAKDWRSASPDAKPPAPNLRRLTAPAGAESGRGMKRGPADGKDDRSPEDVPGPVCSYFFFLVAFFFAAFFFVAFFLAAMVRITSLRFHRCGGVPKNPACSLAAAALDAARAAFTRSSRELREASTTTASSMHAT